MTSLRISIPLDDAPPSKLHPRSPIQERLESALPNRPSLAELHEAQQKAEALRQAHIDSVKQRGQRAACRAASSSARRRALDEVRAARAIEQAARRDEALAKRTKLLASRATSCAYRVKRAIAVAAATREHARQTQSATKCNLEAKLEAAAARRAEARAEEKQRAPLVPPMWRGTAGPAHAAAPSSQPAPSDGGAPASPDGRSASERLLSEVESEWAAADDDADAQRIQAWMRRPETIETARAWLEEVGCDPRAGRLLLGLVYMAREAARLFCDSSEDKSMAREAKRFHKRLLAALKTGEADDFPEDLRRARRFHAAWLAVDKPKVVGCLVDSLVARRAEQAAPRVPNEAGAAVPSLSASADETLEMIRRLGGAEAEAEAREAERRAGEMAHVRAEDLATHVGKVAKRAFWDAVQERLRGGDFECAFGLLGEMQKAMLALVAHSAKAREELADKFDAAWLKQQADNGALELGSVTNLMKYVASTIAAWQAPADEPEARAWVESVEAVAAAAVAERADLGAFIGDHLAPFLARAHELIGRIYERLVAMQQEADGEAAAAEAAAEAEAEAPPQD